ncbi:MFS transporter [Aliikangiella sp. G2MR2-5]|uniref:MFS transporter n=1 Tax=Aliikangiella sp. G2MR2-5 TaxID=2788943 RepID=UPI0018A8FC88|nr:MFS transporter [Aliikangiella sp. G2MR2-5]
MGIPKVDAEGMLVRVLVSFLATAGLFYVNIMPALVDGLKLTLNFTNQQAGLIGSANVYGAAFGAFCIVFFVQKINWRASSYLLLLSLIAIDFLSFLVSEANILAAVRFIHGFVGGSLVGIGFALISKTPQADRTFGMLLLVQFGFGGLGMMYIPQLVESFGIMILYGSLVAFSLITLVMLPFIPDFSNLKSRSFESSCWKLLTERTLILVLLSIFLFQAANMGLYAFIVGLGKNSGLSIAFISTSLGWAAWIGIVGSLLVIWLSTRFGVSVPLLIGIGLTALGTWALIFSANPTIWIMANLGVGITWAFVIPYLFAMCAQLDSNGQVAAMGGLASKLGLASGPVITGILLGEGQYNRVILIAVVVLLISLITSLFAANFLSHYEKKSVSQS